MIPLIARLGWRSLVRQLVIFAALLATATISFVFAWMSPSIVAARMSGLERLPPTTRLSFGGPSLPTPTCTSVFDFVYVQATNGTTAHPGTLFGGPIPSMLGLNFSSDRAFIVADALIADEAGLANGDRVKLVLPDETVEGTALVVPFPARLLEDTTGSVVLNGASPVIKSAIATMEPDRSVCTTSSGGIQVSDLRLAAAASANADGLATAADAFAVGVAAAWSAAILIVFAATAQHRRRAVQLLHDLGQPWPRATLAIVADTVLVAGLAAAAGVVLAYGLRSRVLHMWTAPDAIIEGGLTFAVILTFGVVAVRVVVALRASRGLW